MIPTRHITLDTTPFPPYPAGNRLRLADFPGGHMFIFIYLALVGLVAGWAAGKIMKGSGYGLAMDLVLGVIGSIVGGWIMRILGFQASGLIAHILVAILGAVVVVVLVRLFKKA